MLQNEHLIINDWVFIFELQFIQPTFLTINLKNLRIKKLLTWIMMTIRLCEFFLPKTLILSFFYFFSFSVPPFLAHRKSQTMKTYHHPYIHWCRFCSIKCSWLSQKWPSRHSLLLYFANYIPCRGIRLSVEYLWPDNAMRIPCFCTRTRKLTCRHTYSYIVYVYIFL